MYNSIVRYLYDAAYNTPKKTAIVYEEHEYSYEDMLNNAKSVAMYLISSFDVRKKPIIVLMNNSYSAIVSFWGVAMSGNIYVPIDIDAPMERLNTIFDIVDPACVIICGSRELNCNAPTIQYDSISCSFDDTVIMERIASCVDVDPLYILFTSGSTGVPKGVLVSHRSVIDFVEESTEIMGFSEKEIFLNQAPFYFDASVPDLFCSVRNSATLHLVPKFYYAFPIKLMEYISKWKINAIFWVPSALITVANMRVLEEYDVSCLRKIMFCGEVMPNKQLNIWRKRIPEAVYVNYYGPSEAVYACSYYIVDREFKDEDPLPIGKAAINTELLIVTKENKPAKSNEIGELYIRGTCLAIGYYNDPIKTNESFMQNPLHNLYGDIVYKTGDLAHFDDDNNICFDGRADYQIKHMGYRIELGEIESVSLGMEGVDQAVCIYEEKSDKIYSFYIGNVKEDDLIGYISDRLPPYMIPEETKRVDAFPYNNNGKIDRKRIKAYLEGEEHWMN